MTAYYLHALHENLLQTCLEDVFAFLIQLGVRFGERFGQDFNQASCYLQ